MSMFVGQTFDSLCACVIWSICGSAPWGRLPINSLILSSLWQYDSWSLGCLFLIAIPLENFTN
jgi:hypothetical protein